MPRAEPASIRPATTPDIEAIRAVGLAAGMRFRSIEDRRIAERADDPPFAADELAGLLGSGGVWVAESDGEVVGFLVAEVLDGCAHVEEVSVRPEAEGRGIGTALLEVAADWARTNGYPAVTLTTFRDVPWNRPYYERRGYRILADDELSEALRERCDTEARAGLDPDLRVVMRREV